MNFNIEIFFRVLVMWTPYFVTVLDDWANRNHLNILFLFFEGTWKRCPSIYCIFKITWVVSNLNLISFKDIRKEIRKIYQFLNKKLTDEQIKKLVDHVKVDNFSKNASVNMTMEIKSGFTNEGHSFIRKGQTGDWKNHFSPDLNRRIDKWIAKNLEGSDMKFVTELDQ